MLIPDSRQQGRQQGPDPWLRTTTPPITLHEVCHSVYLSHPHKCDRQVKADAHRPWGAMPGIWAGLMVTCALIPACRWQSYTVWLQSGAASKLERSCAYANCGIHSCVQVLNRHWGQTYSLEKSYHCKSTRVRTRQGGETIKECFKSHTDTGTSLTWMRAEEELASRVLWVGYGRKGSYHQLLFPL